MDSHNILHDTLLKLNPFTETSSGSSPMPTNRELIGSLEKLRQVLREQRLNN